MRCLLLSLALAPLSASAVTLSPEGDCPGVISIDVGDMTAGGNISLIAAAEAGDSAIPAGPCAGVDSKLAGPMRWFGPLPDTDAGGSMSMRPRLPDGACGVSMVALDVSTCEVSPVRVIGAGGSCSPTGDIAPFTTLSVDTAKQQAPSTVAQPRHYSIENLRYRGTPAPPTPPANTSRSAPPPESPRVSHGKSAPEDIRHRQ